MANRRNIAFQISWMTITYRTVALVLLVLVLGAALVAYLLSPAVFVQTATGYANKLFTKLGLAVGSKTPGPVGAQQAHFTALDGTIRVKKANSNTWVTADFSLPLEKGDVVQTSSEGMAKVFFPDGTSYTVKPDSLIVVEENSANEQQQTKVAVQVTTGTVDLSTATYVQGSSSHVIVAGATAALSPESAAMVHNDPRADEHEILVKKGSGQVTRRNQRVTLAEYEKVSFRNDSPAMSRTKEIGPPTLITPPNMMALYTPAGGKPVRFSWTPMSTSHGYRLRVSRNPYFSSTVFDKVVAETEVDVPALKEGAYYWVVTSQDINGHESVESERNRFSIVLRGPEALSVALDLEPFVQHGHIIEVKGKTDPAARVMVNGDEVQMVRADGGFSYFTRPLPNGENIITITAQNAKGGVRTQQKKVVIE